MATNKPKRRSRPQKKPSFAEASWRAELLFGCVGWTIPFLGDRGLVDEAYETLSPILEYDLNCAEPVVGPLYGQLAVVSDGVFAWGPDRGFAGLSPAHVPHVWTSAHEGAFGVARVAWDLLIEPLNDIADPAEQKALATRLLSERWPLLKMTSEEIALWAARVRRERAMLLHETSLSEQQLPDAYWEFDRIEGKVHIGDKVVVKVTGHLAAVLDVLVSHRSISRPELEEELGRNVSDPVGVLRKLMKSKAKDKITLAKYVSLPGARDSGGYRTTIKPMSTKSRHGLLSPT